MGFRLLERYMNELVGSRLDDCVDEFVLGFC